MARKERQQECFSFALLENKDIDISRKDHLFTGDSLGWFFKASSA
jgi:hypothetical protein